MTSAAKKLAELGQYAASADLFLEGIRHAKETNWPPVIVQTMLDASNAFLQKGDVRLAYQTLADTFDVARQLGHPELLRKLQAMLHSLSAKADIQRPVKRFDV